MIKNPLGSDKEIRFFSSLNAIATWKSTLMNAKVENSIRLTNHPKTEKESNRSPGGKSIVFTSNRGVGNWDVYKMDAAGQNVVRLTDDPAKDDRASWSLDGTKIVYTTPAQPLKLVMLDLAQK